ncbi:MAG TPA: very short patch repair endonuclease [bacterium]|nr:very short patch repair endonuclease [bacterium]
MDKVDSATRSRIMSKIRGEGNKSTEWRVRAWMIGAGIRGWKLGSRSDLPGRPDFIFLDARVVVFVDGCFWHGCELCARKRKPPQTNAAFWRKKVLTNKLRDRRQSRQLRRLGWVVVRIKEHSLVGNVGPVIGGALPMVCLNKRNVGVRRKTTTEDMVSCERRR